MTPEEINSKLIIPSEDSATPVKEVEALFIYNFLKEQKITSTLETGLAYARSASHVIAATNSTHIAIDPFQARYGNHGLQNLKALGFDHLLDFRPDFSHNVLPQLVKEDRKFDFIFIDGDHKFDGELVDFYYADLLLNPNGYVLLHDTWMRSTRLLLRFIQTNRKDYVQIPTGLRNLALFRKQGADQRNGMFYKEFYSFKGYISHNAIIWMTGGKPTLLKRAAIWLKEKVK